MLQIVASLTNDSRGTIYDCNMFIVHATGWLFDDFSEVDILVVENLAAGHTFWHLTSFNER